MRVLHLILNAYSPIFQAEKPDPCSFFCSCKQAPLKSPHQDESPFPKIKQPRQIPATPSLAKSGGELSKCESNSASSLVAGASAVSCIYLQACRQINRRLLTLTEVAKNLCHAVHTRRSACMLQATSTLVEWAQIIKPPYPKTICYYFLFCQFRGVGLKLCFHSLLSQNKK